VSPPSASANPVNNVSNKTVTSNNKKSTSTSTAKISPPSDPVSGLRKDSNPVNPSSAIAELTVANTSTRINDISAAINASSPGSNCLGLISVVSAEVDRFETGVRPEIEVVASVIAPVREVREVVTEERAAAVSLEEEVGERVDKVELMAPVKVCTVVKRFVKMVRAEDS